MWELPRVPRDGFGRRVLPPTLLAILVGAILAGAWRGSTDPTTVTLPTLGHTATALADGRVLVVGGGDEDGTGRATAALFDPAASAWRTTGRLRVARRDHAAVRLTDGRVLVVGGGGPAAGSAELYDPTTGRWTTVSP